jgi:23S rRNA (adenine2503-C2)-methyltransferase
VNDTPAQAAALAQRLRRPLYHLNLIAYNETGGEFSRPRPGELEAMRRRLESAAVSVTVRTSPGGEIEAACGQLALRRDGGC